MKTKLIKIIVCATCILTVAGIIFSAQAREQLKGAQLLLQASQARIGTETVATAEPTGMKCAACKSVSVENVTVEKGHIQVVTHSEKHLCATCSTVILTVGAGKEKKSVPTHNCGVSGAACNTKAGA